MTNFREILSVELEEKQRKNPSFSLRAFAKNLGINHGALSQILGGKRTPSYQMATKIMMGLELSKTEEKEFLYSIAKEQFESKPERMNPILRKLVLGKNDYSESTRYLEVEKFKVISDWYHYALFVAVSKDNFVLDYEKLAKNFNLNKIQVERTIERLISVGLLIEDEKGLRQAEVHIDTNDKETTTKAHKKRQIQILEKSINAIQNQDLDKRNHSAMTMAIDPKKIPEAKKRIEKFMNELCEFLESGEKTEIYEIQTSLFSLEK